MAYLLQKKLEAIGFKKLGKNVQISTKASVYDAHLISIGDNVRIDDFCVLSGNIILENDIVFSPFCLIAGGNKEDDLQKGGIFIGEKSIFSYGVKIFSRSNNYLDFSKSDFVEKVEISKNCLVGVNSVIYPGSILGECCSVGAMSFVKGKCDSYGLYIGIPAKKYELKFSNNGGI